MGAGGSLRLQHISEISARLMEGSWDKVTCYRRPGQIRRPGCNVPTVLSHGLGGEHGVERPRGMGATVEPSVQYAPTVGSDLFLSLTTTGKKREAPLLCFSPCRGNKWAFSSALWKQGSHLHSNFPGFCVFGHTEKMIMYWQGIMENRRHRKGCSRQRLRGPSNSETEGIGIFNF